MRQRIAQLASAAALALTVSAAGAQDGVITLKMGGFLPLTHYGVVHGAKIFMDEVTARTAGKVKWEYYPAQQIGKLPQLLDLAVSGVIDVAEVVPGNYSQKLPMGGILEMPGLVPDACSGARAMRELGAPGGLIHQADFAPNGVRAVAFEVLPPYSIHSRKSITSVADLKGMKLRAAGGGMEVSLAKLGAVSVKLTGPEIHDSLAKGTIDGVMLTYLAAKEYSLPEVGKFGVEGYPFGTGAVFFMMSEARFQKLPRNVQEALTEAGKKTDRHFCEHVQGNEAGATNDARAAGVKIHKFSDKDRAELNAALASATDDWARALDARGKPGSRAVQEFKRASGAK